VRRSGLSSEVEVQQYCCKPEEVLKSCLVVEVTWLTLLLASGLEGPAEGTFPPIKPAGCPSRHQPIAEHTSPLFMLLKDSQTSGDHILAEQEHWPAC